MNQRQIKFRAWDGFEIVNRPIEEGIINPSVCDYKAVMQFTGLLDKNGTEIYEGDILQMLPNGMDPRDFWKVKWSDKHLQFRCTSVEGCSDYPLEDFSIDYKIIGNIYENSELLTKSNE